MKKITLFVFLAFAAGGMLFAQTAPALSTVRGTVGLAAGRIVVRDGTALYYTRGLDRLVGFIDGFKDGAEVTLEGYAAPSVEGAAEKWFFPVKMTLNGKTYEVGPERIVNGMPGYRFNNGGGRPYGGPGAGRGPRGGFGPQRRGGHCW